MRSSDLDAFGEMLDAVCSLLSRGAYKPSPTNTALFFRALQEHELAAVRSAFDAHVKDPQRGKFVPTPADVIAQLEGLAEADGRPGAEEAWAMCLRGRDEAETIVWTREMAEAWAVAKSVFDVGDEVGARMSFREAYGRMVDSARRLRMPAAWSLSLGQDPARRIEAVRAAVSAGRLPESELLALAPPAGDLLRLAYEAPNGQASTAEQRARESLRALNERLKARQAEPSRDAAAKARTRERQAEIAAQVAAQIGAGEASAGDAPAFKAPGTDVLPPGMRVGE